MSARIALRKATSAKHEMVDAAYGGYDLADRTSYGRFLIAHARALPAVEAALDKYAALPAFGARTDLLRADLAALGLAMPQAYIVPEPDTDAAAFGALYVIEGSRLGGAMLARTVPAELPRAYLSAIHGSGDWRRFGELLDQKADAGGDTWLSAAIVAAEATFDLYARAARDS